MSKEIAFEIVLDGKSIPHCNSIVIHQRFNAHHTFELVLDQDALGKLASHDLHDYQDYVGRDLYIGFGERNTDDNSFKVLLPKLVCSSRSLGKAGFKRQKHNLSIRCRDRLYFL